MPVAVPSYSAAVLHGPKDIHVESRPAFPPPDSHAQVKVVCTGLCGSDLHYYLHGRNGDFACRSPLVLGHEAAGVVTSVAPGVTSLAPGQRVAIECGIMCNNCNYCSSGRYNLCKALRFCSSAKTFPHLDGTLQDTMNHPIHVLHPLPDNVTFEQAALAEPLSVLIHAARRSTLSPGQSVLVFGVGAIGLLACEVARAKGASKIVAIDINPARLSFAKEQGFADEVYCLPKGDKPKNADEQLSLASNGISKALSFFNQQDGFDIIFECTGAGPCIQMSINAAVTGGKVMLVGMGTPNVTLPLSAAALREVDILGSFRYANTYPEAIALLSSGKLPNIDKLVTHRFPVEQTGAAFDLLARGVDEKGNMVLKVMVGSQS
ncbi:GroES-like protein [Flagelloscypha sp. PMI_526]|nr:GroES-like protein [Flagelloscypha sp. PMI_526]